MSETVYLQNLEKISYQIEKLVENLEIDYIDACLLYCEQNDIEIEQLGELLKRNQKIKASIQVEAENLHFLPKTQNNRIA